MKFAICNEMFHDWPFRRAIAQLSLASLLAGCTVLGGCSKVSGNGWKTTSVDDRFSFQMPGEPTMKARKQDTPVAEINYKVYELRTGNGAQAYRFAATELPAALGEPKGGEIEQRLEGAQQGAVASVKGKLLESKKIQVAGFAVRDLLIQLPSAGIDRIRGVLVHRTLVMMEVINVNSKEAERFFDSLKLLKDSPAPEAAEPAAKPQAKP